MNNEQTVSRIFAHSRLDIIPVLAAVAHLAFDIYLIVGFVSMPVWISVSLGCMQIKDEQKRAGVNAISTCHAFGFLAKESRGIAAA